MVDQEDFQDDTFRRLTAQDEMMMESPHGTPVKKVSCLKSRKESMNRVQRKPWRESADSSFAVCVGSCSLLVASIHTQWVRRASSSSETLGSVCPGLLTSFLFLFCIFCATRTTDAGVGSTPRRAEPTAGAPSSIGIDAISTLEGRRYREIEANQYAEELEFVNNVSLRGRPATT